VSLYLIFRQKSTPSSPDYVAAVVEYSPITDTFEDSSQDIVSKNVANYVLYIRQASLQVGDDIAVWIQKQATTIEKQSFADNYTFYHLPKIFIWGNTKPVECLYNVAGALSGQGLKLTLTSV
jgi:hypothetical protein